MTRLAASFEIAGRSREFDDKARKRVVLVPEAWRAANPALGDFLFEDSFATEAKTVRETTFRQFRLGRWPTGPLDAWMPPQLLGQFAVSSPNLGDTSASRSRLAALRRTCWHRPRLAEDWRFDGSDDHHGCHGRSRFPARGSRRSPHRGTHQPNRGVIGNLAETGVIAQRDDGRWIAEVDFRDQARLPTSVREVIRRRVARLGEETEQVLRAAAVIGRDFELDLLAGVTDHSEEHLLDLLDSATRSSR